MILDLSLPGMDGLELQQLLAQSNKSLAIVFVTGNAAMADSVRAMKDGAVDFLTIPFGDVQLLHAVRAALERSRKLHDSAAEIERCWAAFSLLTHRDRQVCVSVSRGLLNKQVVSELRIKEKTVKLHRSNIIWKLAV